MRLVLSVGIALALSGALPCTAQVHVWPPEPAGPAPITAHVVLLGRAVLPSSERWNLVWADQLLPNAMSEAQRMFVSRNVVATQKIFDWQEEQFRANNADFVAVAYHLALGLNPAGNDDCPDPKSASGSGYIGVVAPKGFVSEYAEYFRPWRARRGIAEGDSAFEALFQHYDAADPAHRVWHRDPAWLMNASDTAWRSYLVETCMDWMTGNRDVGTFFDVAVETDASLYNPNAGNPAPRNFEWWQSPHRPYGFAGSIAARGDFSTYMNDTYRAYFREIYRRFHAGDTTFLVLPNVDQMITTVYDPVWLDGDGGGETVDGAMVESFGRATGADMYLTLERTVRHLTGRGRILIAQAYPGTTAENPRLAAMYMLVKNANSYLNLLSAGGVEWYPEYEIDLGVQSPVPATLDALRVSGSGRNSLWKRDYENGMVLCNTSDQAIDFSLPAGAWYRVRTAGGGPINSDGSPAPQILAFDPMSDAVRVDPSDCAILRHGMPSAVSTPGPASVRIDLYPQPASVSMRLALGPGAHEVRSVEVFDALGREVHSAYHPGTLRPGATLTLDLRECSSGPHLLRLETEMGPVIRIFLVSDLY